MVTFLEANFWDQILDIFSILEGYQISQKVVFEEKRRKKDAADFFTFFR